MSMLELDIRYGLGTNNGQPSVSKELVITNWTPGIGSLF